jgi:hypothetical protein
MDYLSAITYHNVLFVGEEHCRIPGTFRPLIVLANSHRNT